MFAASQTSIGSERSIRKTKEKKKGMDGTPHHMKILRKLRFELELELEIGFNSNSNLKSDSDSTRTRTQNRTRTRTRTQTLN